MKYEYFGKDFDKIQKKYINALERRYKAQKVFNEVRINAECSLCPIFNINDGGSYSSWMTECDTKKSCKKVVESYQYFEKIAKEFSIIQEMYANIIYKNLCISKPKLIRRKDNEVLDWEAVFESDNMVLDEEKQKSLVALVEEDGGKYRVLKE